MADFRKLTDINDIRKFMLVNYRKEYIDRLSDEELVKQYKDFLKLYK